MSSLMPIGWSSIELEGMEPAPCGFQNPDDPDRYCISEAGHSGRHRYRSLNGLVNQGDLSPSPSR